MSASSAAAPKRKRTVLPNVGFVLIAGHPCCFKPCLTIGCPYKQECWIIPRSCRPKRPILLCKLLYIEIMASSDDRSITLYAYVTSPYAMKVHCYLLYKQVPFDVFYVNPIRPERELPIGRQIPVLKIGGDARGQSSAIGEWLDEKFPDTARLIPEDEPLQREVFRLDQWITDTLIPSVFYSVYPQTGSAFVRSISNAMRLGYCVSKTTTNGLPMGIRFLWPLLLRNAGFVRRIVFPVAEQGTARECRMNALSYLDTTLRDRQYLAGTDDPSLADLSAWPCLVVPDRMKLKGFDDFKAYENVSRWLNDIDTFMRPAGQAPPLIPQSLG